ncbi:aminotransferase class III-fold pyridoxal phosphate-dependent enzyme [Acerihabitans arboris]|uniref:Aminotransferase class III-fold pyridoxal phosphate-dependent enzyme n=1 Tax=Acerihabitans arboris TaxID=2691583 RepID=A0A845SJ21_9GAMM|nr:aminotransferase class III-fold pyridoxal phosphate-dependent enzyme [Acerihabitans arboris]NDL65193.1 aminotransferase class III-fold pyridoxal phosphate-dependent enzyme [Acerihabitans arboris]
MVTIHDDGTMARAKKTKYLRNIDEKYMSWGDNHPSRLTIAQTCVGETLTGIDVDIYIDTHMRHSRCNLGYRNAVSPLSAVWARKDPAGRDIFTSGHAHGNFAGHSLGSAAALQTRRYMMSRDYQSTLPEKSAYYLQGLKRLNQKYSVVKQVDGLGMLFNVTLANSQGDPWKNAGKPAVTLGQDYDYSYNGQYYRMMLNSGGTFGEVIKLAPYLDITLAEIDRTMTILDRIIANLIEMGE